MVGQIESLDSIRLVLRLFLGNLHHWIRSTFMVTDDFGRCTCVQCRWLRTCERQIEESAKNCIVLLIQIVTLQCSIFEAFYRPLGAQFVIKYSIAVADSWQAHCTGGAQALVCQAHAPVCPSLDAPLDEVVIQAKSLFTNLNIQSGGVVAGQNCTTFDAVFLVTWKLLWQH